MDKPTTLPVDPGALEDWMFDVMEMAESMSFWLDLKDRIEPADCQRMLSALRLLNLALLDRLHNGHEQFVF
ncbi:hypothetical protein QF001_000800 [Paraburkholderia youngii]|uniref:Uncharacterized protein n=1 Tax=Paraburkholderia youngii TaxID=2782701 RepID=A0A7Y6N4V5_9BURK|nr:hypothetical protein [Paraburkholderia youngii]NUY05914.1 hypothetical protein [Paraburkholderia youngii]